MSPDDGPAAGGTAVTVTGTGFVPGATATVLKLHGTQATAVDCASTTTCTAVTPAHRAGATDVSATVSGEMLKAHTRRTPADRFTYE